MGVADNDGNALGSFPDSFCDGMHNRQRVLGDSHEPAWEWGSVDRIDAVVLLYAQNDENLEAELNKEEEAWKQFGSEQRARIPMTLLNAEDLTHPVANAGKSRRRARKASRSPDKTKNSGAAEQKAGSTEVGEKNLHVEHFGFRDGVSQPVIEGTRRFHEGVDPNHAVKPGEFILGYHNNQGYFPPTPVVAPDKDPDRILANRPRGLPDRYPDFGSGEREAPRDLGRNGSFLVIRQLKQDVDGFNGYIIDKAEEIVRTYDGVEVPDAEKIEERANWIAAKMMGRWKDGTSLVRYPDTPPDNETRRKPDNKTGRKPDNETRRKPDNETRRKPDNDFLFGVDDPQGLRCPYGAHVRRVNPRDSFRAGSAQQIAISNRHRLLRVGRTYKNGAEKGLLFMCLNADIERQFEFIQKTWIGSTSFHGLSNERDPIAANPCSDNEMSQAPNDAGDANASEVVTGSAGSASEEASDQANTEPAREESADGGEFTIPTLAGPMVLKGLDSFVSVRGGGYFFIPSKSALRFLCSAKTD